MANIDPITFQVISTALTGIVREMQLLLFRTGYSTAIRESQDASCAILDKQGNLVGQFRSLYMHMGIFRAMTDALFNNYPPSQMADGDVFILNHPYQGGSTHVSDMGVIAPVFYHGELVAFCASMAHKTDIGGNVPGSASAQATEIYQEGLLVPPVRYMSGGQVSREVEALLRANSRTPAVLVGDIRGQVGVCRVGGDRLRSMMDKYSNDTIQWAFDEVMARTEKRVRDGVRKWPDGSATVDGFLDPDGILLHEPVKLSLEVTKKGDSLVFDFTGCDEQSQSPLNLKATGTATACYFGIVATIDPTLPNNEGLCRAIQIKFRPHSVVNPDPPGAVSCYAFTVGRVLNMVVTALRQVAGQRAIAESGTGGALTIGGRSILTGSPYIQYELLGCGGGAVEGDDGMAGVYGARGVPGHVHEVPIEIVETEFACRMLRYELIPDSGGAGRFRGGLGAIKEYLILDKEARMGIRSAGFIFPARGDMDGQPGRPCIATLNPGSEGARSFPCRIANVNLKPGDILRMETGGGGGVGNPRERRRESVLEDIENNYVTPHAAAEVYGLKDSKSRKK